MVIVVKMENRLYDRTFIVLSLRFRTECACFGCLSNLIYIDADDRKIFEVIFLLPKRGKLNRYSQTT